MNKRSLGNTGIMVSEIAFGGVEIGLPYGIGVHSEKDMPSRAESIHLLHSAFDNGINFFDTARSYGHSEEIMGQAFKSCRDQVIISTKCGKLRNDSGVFTSAKKIIEKSLEESLEALQTDYIDVYMLHQADLEILENETIAATFLELKKKGIIRATGVSTYSVEETNKAIISGNWDVVQLPFNLMDQTQEANFSLAVNRGVGIMVRSVLFKGILTNRGRDLHAELKDVEEHIELYKELSSKYNDNLATLATKFALSHKEISSVLVGIDRQDYLTNTLALSDGKYFEEKMLLKAKRLQYPDLPFLDLVKWNKLGWLT